MEETARQRANRHWREKHPGYASQDYKTNVDRYKQNAKKRKHDKRQYATPDELAICVANPLKAITLRAEEGFRICLGKHGSSCGQLLKTITHKHLTEHGFTSADEYKREWGYPKNEGLTSTTSADRRRVNNAPLTDREPGRRALEKFRQSGKKPRTGPLPAVTVQRRREVQRGRLRSPISKGERDAEIVQLYLLEEKSIEEINSELGLSETVVYRRLQEILGIRVKQKIKFLHGKPLTEAHFENLRPAFSGDTQLAEFCGLKGQRVQDLTRFKKNRALTLKVADGYIAGEKKLLKVLTSDKGNAAGHLLTVFSDLQQRYRALCDAAKIFRDHGLDAANCRISLADLCRRSISGESDARIILGWLPEVFTWLKADPQRLALPQSRIASDFLPISYTMPSWVMGTAIRESRAPSPTGWKHVRYVVQMSQKDASVAVPKNDSANRKTRPPKRISPRTLAKGKLCSQIMQEVRTVKKLCVDSGRTIVEVQIDFPDFHAWKLRETLTAEDRETFNNPRQWGPVVGYAEMILAKHFGRSAETIHDWVKGYRATTRNNPELRS